MTARFAALQEESDRNRERAEMNERRLASYESFQKVLQESVAASLLHVQDDLAERLARLRHELGDLEQRRASLTHELEGLRVERSKLEATIEALRPNASALRELATEMLRSVFADVTGVPSAAMPPVMSDATAAARRLELVETPEEIRAPGLEPNDLRLVLSPIRSLPHLLAIENQIQSLPGVSALYVQSYDDESARLRLSLTGNTSRDDFVKDLDGLTRPRMRVDSAIDGEFHLRVLDDPGTA